MRLIFTLSLLYTIWVSTNAQIFVNQDATGNNDGTSWADAFTDLQSGIEEANLGDQVWVAAGTYIPTGFNPEDRHFVALNPVKIYGGFIGTESKLNERDWKSNATIISGDFNGDDVPDDFINGRSDNAHHIFIIKAGKEESVLDGLIFKGGTTNMGTPSSDATDWSGGALYIYNSKVVIRNCSFKQNDAWRGSGIFAFGGGTDTVSLDIENSDFVHNNCYNFGAAFLQGWQSLNLSNCRFSENSGYQSGGVFFSGSNAYLDSCLFEKNYAGFGGACYAFHGSASLIEHVDISFNNCIFLENNISHLGGAVIFDNRFSGFNLEFNYCTFSKNGAAGGGAIEIADSKDFLEEELNNKVTINHSDFMNNTATLGGAIQIEMFDDSLIVDITNSNFIENAAEGGEGGAFRLFSTDQAILLAHYDNLLMDNNSAKFGGAGIIVGAENIYPIQYKIENCMVKNNSATNLGGAFYSQGAFSKNIGIIKNSDFIHNMCEGGAGAIISLVENLKIEHCNFDSNSTSGNLFPEYNGGGAILAIGFIGTADTAQLDIMSSRFTRNMSAAEGAAIFTYGKENMDFQIENSLLNNNAGSSTIYNGGVMNILNNSLIDNSYGLFVADSTSTVIQNSIFNNIGENLNTIGKPNGIFQGGNISGDDSMSPFLTGFDQYEDLNETDPLLNLNFVPLDGSPCIDAGNPQGVSSQYDLDGNPRIQGNGIDIGCYESLAVAVKEAIWDNTAFSLFPNPVKNEVNVKLVSDWIGEVRVDIYNHLGQQVYHGVEYKSEETQSFRKEISQLPAGEYLILAVSGNITNAAKIIVQF